MQFIIKKTSEIFFYQKKSSVASFPGSGAGDLTWHVNDEIAQEARGAVWPVRCPRGPASIPGLHSTARGCTCSLCRRKVTPAWQLLQCRCCECDASLHTNGRTWHITCLKLNMFVCGLDLVHGCARFRGRQVHRRINTYTQPHPNRHLCHQVRRTPCHDVLPLRHLPAPPTVIVCNFHPSTSRLHSYLPSFSRTQSTPSQLPTPEGLQAFLSTSTPGCRGNGM